MKKIHKKRSKRTELEGFCAETFFQTQRVSGPRFGKSRTDIAQLSKNSEILLNCTSGKQLNFNLAECGVSQLYKQLQKT